MGSVMMDQVSDYFTVQVIKDVKDPFENQVMNYVKDPLAQHLRKYDFSEAYSSNTLRPMLDRAIGDLFDGLSIRKYSNAVF